MRKNFILKALSFLTAMTGLSACNSGNQSTETGNSQDSAPAQQNNANVDKRCKAAIDKITWDNVNRAEALKACQLFHTFLISQYQEYEFMIFTMPPAPPYYFMEAGIEREINPAHVIDVQNGVLPKNSTETIQAFVKHIDILNTHADARTLARMLYCFTAGATEDLVTSHRAAEAWRPEMNPPDFHKNDDGSATLTYDLHNMGRSTAVRECVITIHPDYQTTLTSTTKAN